MGMGVWDIGEGQKEPGGNGSGEWGVGKSRSSIIRSEDHEVKTKREQIRKPSYPAAAAAPGTAAVWLFFANKLLP